MEKKHSGGGPALTSGIHLVDRLRWFVGDEVKTVSGSATNQYFNGDVEDAGQMLLQFRSGISAQITVAFMRDPHPLVCDLQLIGTKGSIVVHTWHGYELWNQAGHKRRTFYTDQEHRAKVEVGVAGEIREFCASIIERRTPWPSAEDSTRSFRVVMAYYEAAETGRAIQLGDFDAV
jgi:predicted dehydrogenase